MNFLICISMQNMPRRIPHGVVFQRRAMQADDERFVRNPARTAFRVIKQRLDEYKITLDLPVSLSAAM